MTSSVFFLFFFLSSRHKKHISPKIRHNKHGILPISMLRYHIHFFDTTSFINRIALLLPAFFWFFKFARLNMSESQLQGMSPVDCSIYMKRQSIASFIATWNLPTFCWMTNWMPELLILDWPALLVIRKSKFSLMSWALGDIWLLVHLRTRIRTALTAFNGCTCSKYNYLLMGHIDTVSLEVRFKSWVKSQRLLFVHLRSLPTPIPELVLLLSMVAHFLKV